MIPIFWPSAPKYRLELLWALAKQLKTRWYGQGSKVDEFERAFGAKFGYEFCTSVNSGSAALELAYKLAGIKKGDKVIVPVFTCTATNIPLVRMGAKLIFADINKMTWTPEYADIVSKISGAKAIVTVNLGGIECNENIYRIAKELNIPVIVDACQSLGVSEPHGDFVCYSFQAIKHFTTGDGGILVTRNSEHHARAKRLRWFGIDREAKKNNDWHPYKNREMIMDFEEPGYKFHMNDIAAVFGLIGLKHSDELLNHRRMIARIYDSEIQNCHKVRGGSFWLYGLEVENRDEFARKLKEAGIETNIVQMRNDIFKVFGGKRRRLPNMNYSEDRIIYIPIHNAMSLKDAKKVACEVNKALCGSQ